MEVKDEEILKSLKIDNYEYSFKQRKANNFFAYRCKNRKYGVLISIDICYLKKIIDNNKLEGKIEFQKLSKKDHTCDKNNIIIEDSKVQTNTQMMKLAEKINQNLDKSKT